MPAALAGTILFVCLPLNFNIELRHILPIYPFFSIIAGLGLVGLWRAARFRIIGRVSAVGLLVWQLVSTGLAHPDYLAYFNATAGGHPETILVGDLDEGQDLPRLVDTLRARHIDEIAISYQGTADLTRAGLPTFRPLKPYEPTSGWVAISLYNLKTGGVSAPPDAYAWLEPYKPMTSVGKSIRLYYVRSTSIQ
jgi:hypothetical protein